MCRIDLFEGEAHLAHIFAKRRRNGRSSRMGRNAPVVTTARVCLSLYQVVKRPTLLPISQISRDLIQRRRGEFDMAAPISLRGDFDGPMLRALVLAEKAGSVTRRLLSLVTIY